MIGKVNPPKEWQEGLPDGADWISEWRGAQIWGNIHDLRRVPEGFENWLDIHRKLFAYQMLDAHRSILEIKNRPKWICEIFGHNVIQTPAELRRVLWVALREHMHKQQCAKCGAKSDFYL